VVTIVVVAVLSVELLVPLEPLLLVLDSSVEGLIIITSGTESDEGETIAVDLSAGDVAVSLGRSLLELVDLVLETMSVMAVVSRARCRGSRRSRGRSSGGVLRTVMLLVGGRLSTILAVVLVVVSTVLVAVVSVVVPLLELQDLLGELLDLGRLLDSVMVGFTITEVGEDIEDVQFDFSVMLELVVLLVSQSVDED